MSFRTRLPAVVTFVLLVAGCSSDATSPANLLIGRYGDPVQHAELVALHGGAELMLPCGGYFTSGAPIALGTNQQFSSKGKWYPQSFGVPVSPLDATLAGGLSGDVVTLNLRTAGSDDPIVYTLQRDVSGQLDKVVCALTSRAP